MFRIYCPSYRLAEYGCRVKANQLGTVRRGRVRWIPGEERRFGPTGRLSSLMGLGWGFMSFIASAVVRELVAVGVTGDALVAALERIEAADRADEVSTLEYRRKRDRERKQAYRSRPSADNPRTIVAKTSADNPRTVSQNGSNTKSVRGHSADIVAKNFPPDLLTNKTLGELFPEVPLKGESSPRARESGGDVELAQPEGKPKKRATRIPENFEPDLGVAQEIGLSFDEAMMESASFVDYWRAKPSEATKLDWPATWRVWCRKSWKDRRRSDGANRTNGNGYHANGHNGHGGPAYFDRDGNRLTGHAAAMAEAVDKINRNREREAIPDARH